MKIEIRGNEKTKYICLSGDFTITSLQEFQDSVFPMLDTSIAVLAIDMSDVTFLDSSGIGKLVQIVNLAKKKNISFFLVGVQDQVFRSLKSIRMESFFAITDKKSFEEKYL